MVKSCCAPGCENRWSKGSGLSFYRFPVDPIRGAQWVAAVSSENWEPTEYSWLCSAHFVSGSKSNDKLSPDYVASIFSHVTSPRKHKAKDDLHAYTRKEAQKKRSEALSRQMTSHALLSLAGEDSATATDSIEKASETATDSREAVPESGVTEMSTMTDLNMGSLDALEGMLPS